MGFHVFYPYIYTSLPASNTAITIPYVTGNNIIIQ